MRLHPKTCVPLNLGGLDRDSQSWRQKRVSLDGRENLDSFKKLVLKIEISQSRSTNLNLVSMSLAKTVLFGWDQDLSRLVKTCQDFCDYKWFLWISQFFSRSRPRHNGFLQISRWDFSSQPYLFTFCASKLASKWAKSVGNSNFFFKKSKQKSWLSQKIMAISIKILTQPSLDRKVSILKISTEKKKILVSTWWIISTVFKS